MKTNVTGRSIDHIIGRQHLTLNDLDPARPLESLISLGFTLKLDGEQQLRVKPTRNIDAFVHSFLIANKRLLVMEIAGLVVPCGECHRNVAMIYESGISTSEDAGMWFSASCRCGHEVYVCERDYWHWRVRNRVQRRRLAA